MFVLGAVSDITERKAAEAKIEQQALVLQRSNEELQQFAYVASHDLQEPLRKVASFCELLGAEYAEQVDEDGQQYIRYAIDGANRMKALIQDLLSYSRVESQGKPLQIIDANASLQMALENLETAIEESSAVVTCDELPSIAADQAQFSHLLQNLIGNAIKYRGDRIPEIHVGVEKQEKETVFSVADNGIGIDPQFHERIFGIFKRLHGRGEYSGTGIGLAICKRIVERMGGAIWVKSGTNDGCTFYFTVPAHHNSTRDGVADHAQRNAYTD